MNALPAVCLALALAAPGPKDAKKDPPSIVGVWVIDSVSAGEGVARVQPPAATTIYTADGKFEYRTTKGEKYRSGTYTVDPKKNPAEIDLTGEAAPGVVRPGIYKLDGDSLTIGLGNPGVRPTAFEDAPGAAMYLYVYKRAKKD